MPDNNEKKKDSEQQKVPGSEGREPSEGKWVAEPRVPDPKDEGDGIARLTSQDAADSANPKNLEKGPDQEDIEEKRVEGGVEDNKIDVETEVALNPRNI